MRRSLLGLVSLCALAACSEDRLKPESWWTGFDTLIHQMDLECSLTIACVCGEDNAEASYLVGLCVERCPARSLPTIQGGQLRVAACGEVGLHTNP